MKNIAIAVSLFCGVAFLPVRAVAVDQDVTGWYVAMGGGFAVEDAGNNPTTIGNAPALTVRAGYRPARRIAVELGFDYYYSFDVDGMHSDSSDAWSLTGNLKYFLPLEKLLPRQVQPYFLVGVGGIRFEADNQRDSDFSSALFRIGGGIDFPVYDRWSLGIETPYAITAKGSLKHARFVPITAVARYTF